MVDPRAILTLDLEPTHEAPSLARAAVNGFSSERPIDTSTRARLTLLVSELVTNAVIHPHVDAAAQIRLHVRLCDELIRVEVTDRGAGFTPEPRDPARPERGYGLYLVEHEASRWGVERTDGTKVWFELLV